MKFNITIESDNDALVSDGETEVSQILTDIAARIKDGRTGGQVHDINGNTVGRWTYIAGATA